MKNEDALMEMIGETGDTFQSIVDNVLKKLFPVEESEDGGTCIVDLAIKEYNSKIRLVISLANFCGVEVSTVIKTNVTQRLTGQMLYSILAYGNEDGEKNGGLYIDESDALFYRNFYPIRGLNVSDFIFALRRFATDAFELNRFANNLNSQ